MLGRPRRDAGAQGLSRHGWTPAHAQCLGLEQGGTSLSSLWGCPVRGRTSALALSNLWRMQVGEERQGEAGRAAVCSWEEVLL